MADKKLSALTELNATPAVDDELYIRDVSEAAADESKRITTSNLLASKEDKFDTNGRAYQNAAQILDDSQVRAILLDIENYDTGNDLDVTVKTANCDATEAFKLHDADGGFEVADVGATVWNTTDNTYAVVSAFVDAGELTLDTDIMVNGEGYKLFRSWFICPADGKYLVLGAVRFATLADGVLYAGAISVNAASKAFTVFNAAALSSPSAPVYDIIDCSANDKIQLGAAQFSGGVEELTAGSEGTYLAVHRLS